MKQKDYHVLDWSKIVQDTSKQNSTTSSDNKGVVFEDLIEKLLSAMYPPGAWRRTGKSHDGKRDFVYPAEEYLNEQKWAECKNYESALSLNIIAPTLVMGAIEQIGCIIFFSYSRLNDNAIDGLLRYSETCNQDVQIFDGNLLESLICKYHSVNGISDFFPNTDFEKASQELQKNQLRIIRNLQDINGNKLSASHVYELGEMFCFRVIVQNISWTHQDCTVTYQGSRKSRVRLDAISQSLSLPFAGIKECTLMGEAICAGCFKCIVKITVKGPHPFEKTVSSKVLINDVPHLAWSGENALHVRQTCLNHLYGYVSNPLIIAAESGTGKSTLLHILQRDELVREKYKILSVDLGVSRNSCVRSLLSQIVGVQGKDITPAEQRDDEKILSLMIENYVESTDIIVDAIMGLYDEKCPYLFFVDDIQEITRPYIDFIHTLDEYAEEHGMPIYYVFCLNEDIELVEDLQERLSWDKSYLDRCCVITRLKKFNRIDTLTYLKTQYGLHDIDEYFEDFSGEVSPLELQTFCAGLKTSRVITQKPKSSEYQIVDRYLFSEGIRETLYAGTALTRACDSLDPDGVPAYILKVLYITNRISERQRSKDRKVIQGLIDQKLLREIDGDISFYHTKIREAVGEKLSFSGEDYADIFANKDTDTHAKAICALKNIGRLRNGDSFLSDYFSTSAGISRPSQRYTICCLIFENMDKLADAGMLTSAIKFVNRNYTALNEEQGHDTFFCFLKQAADAALRVDWDIDKDCVENIAYLIKKYFDRALSSYNYDECADYFHRFEKKFKEIKNISEDRRNFWLSHYANRAAISLDRGSSPLLPDGHEISQVYELSKHYCIGAGHSAELELQMTVDDFYRHYVYRHDLTLDILENTYTHLEQMADSGLIDSMVLTFHLLLVNCLMCHIKQGTDADWKRILAEIKVAKGQCHSAYYLVKLYYLEILIHIFLHEFNEAFDLLPNAFKFAYKKDMRKYIHKLTYIKAYIMILQNNYVVSKEAYQELVLALEQLLSAHKGAVNNLKREAFLIVQLGKAIDAYEPKRLKELAKLYDSQTGKLLRAIIDHIHAKETKEKCLFEMQSYFMFGEISFPTP